MILPSPLQSRETLAPPLVLAFVQPDDLDCPASPVRLAYSDLLFETNVSGRIVRPVGL